jgi:hypothetical protein
MVVTIYQNGIINKLNSWQKSLAWFINKIKRKSALFGKKVKRWRKPSPSRKHLTPATENKNITAETCDYIARLSGTNSGESDDSGCVSSNWEAVSLAFLYLVELLTIRSIDIFVGPDKLDIEWFRIHPSKLKNVHKTGIVKSKTKVKPQKHLTYEISNSQHVPERSIYTFKESFNYPFNKRKIFHHTDACKHWFMTTNNW